MADLEQVFETANRQLGEIVAACSDDRELSLEDRRFYSLAGGQWEGAVGDQFANRPRLEINKVHLSVVRIINEYRNNRVSAKFVSKDGADSDELADAMAGMYRADQQDSNAGEAQDNAFEEAVGGGFGAFRLTNKYEDEYDDEDDRQRVCWEPITDADTCVFFDPNSKRKDKSDAKYCFVLTSMTRRAFEDEWGEDVSTFPAQIQDADFSWNDQSADAVYVAEYFVCEDASEKVLTFRNIQGEFEKHKEADLSPEKRRELSEIGTVLVAERKVKTRRVRKYFLSGSGVLEDAGYIAGRHIPIVPVYGKWWFVSKRERFMGHVRLAKDAQRLYNMQVSVLAEQAASGGEETPVFMPEQIEGHRNAWATKAVDRPAYLLLNPITDADGNEVPAGPVDYTRAPQVPSTMSALIELSGRDIEDVLGNQEAGEQIETNMSGKAVELIQNRLDMQAFIYMSNYAVAEKRAAQIWMSMASEIYTPDDSRTMRVIDAQDQIDYIDLGETVLNDDGDTAPMYDLARAKFDVAVEIGPTSASKRSATVRALTQMLPLLSDPADQAVVSAMALMNMEGEGIGPVRDYFRKKMVQMGVVDPTDAEAEEMAQAAEMAQQPSPQDQYLAAESAKANAQAMESQADAQEAIANAGLKEAQRLKTLADIDREAQEAAINAASALRDAATPSPLIDGSMRLPGGPELPRVR